MRRHAKASTAGSTQRQAAGLGRFVRGSLATRASSHGVRGSGAPSRAGGLFGLACLAILALAALLGTAASSASGAEECPNEIRRSEQGLFALRLPDCRAYEDVSPGSLPEEAGIRAALDGDTVAYQSIYPALGEETSGHLYVSKRAPGGWVRRDVSPQEFPETNVGPECQQHAIPSADLSANVLEQGLYEEPPEESLFEGFCNEDGEPHEVLDPREVPGYRNVFVHDLGTNAYQLASLDEAEGTPGNSHFEAGSDDFGTIAISSEAQLTADAVGATPAEDGSFNTFVWSGGVLRLATYLPDGTPVQADLVHRAGAFNGFDGEDGYEYSNAVSNDGSKLFFKYAGALYMRVNPAQPQSAISGGECTEPEKACTVQVDKSQGPGASGGGVFEIASSDGSRVFFTSDHKMTADSTAVAGKEDLYEFDTETGDLTDLTVNASEPADVWAIADINADGSYVYFVTEAALDGSGATTPGDCERYEEGNTCNLYVRHNGVTTYIASLAVDDAQVFDGPRFFFPGQYGPSLVEHHAPGNLPRAESSPNGRYFAFNSFAEITGEGNGVFLYDAVADQLSCVSCDEGWAVTDPDFEGIRHGIFPMTHFEFNRRSGQWRRNQVLDNGSVLFATSTALVPADTNEARDVYGYENGQLFLVSSGAGPSPSNFLDATPGGSDAYFTTADGLIPGDTNGVLNLYDARIDGGFAEPPPLPGCEGEACRGAGSAAPVSPATGTASFQGPGNQAQKHKADCGLNAKRAQKLAREAKSLRRRAKQAGSEAEAKRLRHQAAQLAKQGQSISKSAKRCRRANRGAGK